MTTQSENQEISQSNCYDPFPEPQTIPSGWDVSGLLFAFHPAPVETDSEPDQA